MNLFEISSYLQKIPESPEGTKALMDYANGSSAVVPSYVALAELNRRKLLKDTQAASEQAPQQSLKDQLQNELLGGAAQQMQQTGPGIAPQIANPVPQMPQQQMPQQPMQQEMPQQAPQQEMPQQMPQMAEGGLASVPIDMFRRTSFAPGGIVAFSGEDDEQLVRDAELYAEEEAQGGAKEDRLGTERKNPNRSLSNTGSGLKKETEKAIQIQKEKEPERGIAGIDLGGFKIPEFKERTEPNFDEELANVKKQKAALGISDDPYAGVRDLRNQLEKMQESGRANETQDRLMALLGGSHPSGNWFLEMGAGAEKAQQLKGLQQAKREKDLERKMEYTKLDIQEDQARRKGDLDAVKAAIGEKQRLQREDRQDATTFGNMQASIMSGQGSLMSAQAAVRRAAVDESQEDRAKAMQPFEEKLKEAQIKQYLAQAAQAGRPSEIQQKIDLATKNPALFERMYGEPYEVKAFNILAKDPGFLSLPQDEQERRIYAAVESLKRARDNKPPPPAPAAPGERPGILSALGNLFGSKPAGPELPPGLPPGSKYVGTSGGKPVYEVPGGQRVIGK